MSPTESATMCLVLRGTLYPSILTHISRTLLPLTSQVSGGVLPYILRWVTHVTTTQFSSKENSEGKIVHVDIGIRVCVYICIYVYVCTHTHLAQCFQGETVLVTHSYNPRALSYPLGSSVITSPPPSRTLIFQSPSSPHHSPSKVCTSRPQAFPLL